MADDTWWMGNGDRFGKAVPPHVDPRHGTVLPMGMEPRSAALFETILPRGVPVGRADQNRSERAQWASPDQIASLAWKPGDLVLGTFNGQLLGYNDDKVTVTIASARSGKSSTVLIPTLLTYKGSMLVLDPKGELARETAQHRSAVLGQKVYCFDPFGCTAEPSTPFNPLSELDPGNDLIVDDADKIAQALIVIDAQGGDADYWTQSAQFLIRGLVLYAMTLAAPYRTLVTVRQLLTSTFEPILRVAHAEAQAKAKDGVKLDERVLAQRILFAAMAASKQFDGALAAVGASFLNKPEKERGGIIGTAETQTRFIDSLPMQRSLSGSQFKLECLADGPMNAADPTPGTTIYLCLSAGEMPSHFRWLRLIVGQAVTALERRGTWPLGKLPILFMMEEFAVLGHMAVMEQAAAYFPGFGVKLQAVLQDLSQLKRHYRHSWETFLGNAGLVQFFANADQATKDYVSARIGMTSFALKGNSVFDIEGEAAHKERLIYPHEIEKVFSRRCGTQGLLIEGRDPVATLRLTHGEVAALRQRLAAGGPVW